MKFEIENERVFPHPPGRVWRALTDREALGEWLMETDFKPEIGRAFTMWCDDGEGGTDTYLCNLLEYDPPHRMLWSWVLEGREALGATLVAFRVEAVADGTKVTITHSGDRDADTVENFKNGWPGKVDRLDALLSRDS